MLLFNKIAPTVILFVYLFCSLQKLSAQCAAPVAIFPYTQGFETNNGGWVTGGSLSDWAWGTPSKTVITGAATGAKCWIVGGLTGGSYNNSEASWLESPCFNFTSLQYPYISFNAFWETERKYDGASFQYSTNLGASWINVGTIADPVSCLNDNWFNYSPITYINTLTSVKDGWSGNIQSTAGNCQGGGGSGRWVNAKRAMPNLAGVSNVIFRFIFGAGTTCNNFEGFAVDDIFISNAPPNNASFSYSCTNNTTINFINTSDLCPLTNWNFGDPTSGVNNISTQTNPTHVFSAPGTYTITLQATGSANAPSSTSQTIHILGINTSVISNNNCFGDNSGSASVSVIPVAAAPFFYNWSTTPTQTTLAATGLASGIYTVTVNALNSCTITATATITSPPALSHIINIVQPGCGLATGTATITESGGTVPYSYSWFPQGGTGPTASSLTPGNYIVTVTDRKGCIENINLIISAATPPSIAIINKKDITCFGLSDGAATALVTGSAPFRYSWNTVPVQNTASAINLSAGNYTITVTDNNGCSIYLPVQIIEQLNGACGDIYFPNAFTPNGNFKNDNFGAMGNIAAISSYLLRVYNRYGELVFYTQDPLIRWDGFYKGKQNTGIYIWTATFIYKGQVKKLEQGTVLIIK